MRKKLVLAYWWSALALFLLFALSSPKQLFKAPYASVLEDRDGKLLSARIADDGQWRFPPADSVPTIFEKCLLAFEDQYFYRHPGVNPISAYRAAVQNLKAGSIKSGASTLTMQLVRLSRPGKPRSLWQKLIETFLALRLELQLSKPDILRLYSSHAPFGGNIVGLEAASWRYYGRDAHLLSWGESATLAVLPNAPSLVFPGKNEPILLSKRNSLLDKVKRIGLLDSLSCELAKLEPLCGHPKPLPSLAPHLLERIRQEKGTGKRFRSSLNKTLQERAKDALSRYTQQLAANQIFNAGLLVLDVESGQALAYVGNTQLNNPIYGCEVDMVKSLRSTGSILKPFLYAQAQQRGIILPKALLPDVPTNIAGYSPKNFNKGYLGAVPADKALAMSLNIPAVRLLHQSGVEAFHSLLPKIGISSLNKPHGHYGLSIILGGGEASLWELTGAYASMARTLKRYNYDGLYLKNSFRPPTYSVAEDQNPQASRSPGPLDAASIWLSLQAMLGVNRPLEEAGWQYFDALPQVAWKTGTSFGHRDAWAIGTDSRHAVGAWVGNADGEGRPGLTGNSKAAPLMFELFRLLPTSDWFTPPYDELKHISTCQSSGLRNQSHCHSLDSIWVHPNGLRSLACPYHQAISVDASGRYQLTRSCAHEGVVRDSSWFVLPPVEEWYYRQNNAQYRPLPPFLPGCNPGAQEKALDVIYPEKNAALLIPIDLDGKPSRLVLKAAHRRPSTTIYWHLDERYLGETANQHEMEILAAPGDHELTLVDEKGNSVERAFRIIGN